MEGVEPEKWKAKKQKLLAANPGTSYSLSQRQHISINGSIESRGRYWSLHCDRNSLHRFWENLWQIMKFDLEKNVNCGMTLYFTKMIFAKFNQGIYQLTEFVQGLEWIPTSLTEHELRLEEHRQAKCSGPETNYKQLVKNLSEPKVIFIKVNYIS